MPQHVSKRMLLFGKVNRLRNIIQIELFSNNLAHIFIVGTHKGRQEGVTETFDKPRNLERKTMLGKIAEFLPSL